MGDPSLEETRDAPPESNGLSPTPEISRSAAASMPTMAAETMDGVPALPGAPGSAESMVDQLARGQHVGRYLVLGTLGAGGMGIVYAAYDPKLDRKIALKLVRSGFGGENEGARSRLLREAQAMAKLTHPNVVTVHDVGTLGDRVFVAMEFVDGQTLKGWLEEQPRSWREVLAVMMAAGRGLAAAHRKKLVHRDFKPDNVMIAQDGRVLVMDFGLARSDVLGAKAASDTSRLLEDVREVGALGLAQMELTRAGGLLGTPAYMSPEQFLADPADARSDQFSFCVALYEALYGERPFAGATMGELLLSVTEGKVRPEPRSHGVPRWLRQVLLRGLAVHQDDRWPDMDALLAELGRDRASRRRLLVIGLAIAGALLAGVGGARARKAAAEQACQAEAAAIDEVWNSSSQDALRRAMLASGVPHAEDTYERMRPWIDAWVEGWRTDRVRMCRAHDVDGTLDDELWGRARSCFGQQQVELQVMLEQYAEVDARTLPSVVTSAATFAQLESCADPAFLALRPGAPVDARGEPVAAIGEVRGELSRARSLETAGDVPGAVLVAKRAHEQAEKLGWGPLESEAQLELGRLYAESGRYEESHAELRRAFTRASGSGDDLIAARSAVQLLRLLGFQLSRSDEALIWGEVAQALLERLDRVETLDGAALANNTGLAHQAAGRLELAEAAHELALRRRVALLGDRHPEDAHSYGNLGNVATVRRELDLAREWHGRALEVRRAAYGDAHPDTARSLNNLGNVELADGKLPEAIALFERAIAVWEPSLGVDHPTTARGYRNLGRAHRLRGDAAEALVWSRRAYEVLAESLGETHPTTASAWKDLTALCESGLDDACAYVAAQRGESGWSKPR